VLLPKGCEVENEGDMASKKSEVENMLESDLANFLLQSMPVGIIVLNDKLNITYRNGEGKKLLERDGLPSEVPLIGGRILDAFRSSRLSELFPGGVHIEKRLGNFTSKWLFKLHLVDGQPPRIVVFFIEEAISNQLNINEITLRYRLTFRETDVLRHVLKGLKNADIAEELNIAEQTIKDHLSNIYRKIGIGNRTELMRIFLSPES
jgi:DNA-binding CsgD family transcriptional regulator